LIITLNGAAYIDPDPFYGACLGEENVQLVEVREHPIAKYNGEYFKAEQWDGSAHFERGYSTLIDLHFY